MDNITKKQTLFHEKMQDLFSFLFPKKQPVTISAEKKQLLSDIEEALSDLRYARSCFTHAQDPEIIEACIYEIKSAEARYNFLLRKAKLMSERYKNASV